MPLLVNVLLDNTMMALLMTVKTVYITVVYVLVLE